MFLAYHRRYNLTERVNRVLELADDTAGELGHGIVTPWHVALGLLREGQGVGVTAMRTHGVSIDAVVDQCRKALLGSVVAGGLSATRDLTTESEALLTQARSESQGLGHSYVGTEHILLALLCDRDNATSVAFSRHGIDYQNARARILWILGSDIHNPEPFVAPNAV